MTTYPLSPTTIPAPPASPAYWPVDGLPVWALLAPVMALLAQDVERGDGNAVSNHLADLQACLGTTATALANMTALLEMAQLKVLQEMGDDPKAPKEASLRTKYLKAKVGGYAAAYEYTDRLNAGVTHSIEAMRSILSWLKAERNTYTLPNHQ